MNHVVLIGNLTKDPETRYNQNNTAICRFRIAVNEKRKNPQTGEYENNPSFIPIVVFGRSGENCEKYLSKGSKVAVSGRIQTGSYEKQDGTTVYTTDVIANSVEFLSQRQDKQVGFNDNSFANQQPVEGFEPISDEDLPF